MASDGVKVREDGREGHTFCICGGSRPWTISHSQTVCLSFAAAEQLWLADKLQIQTFTSSFRTVCSSTVLFTMTPTVVLSSHSSCIFYVLYICWETVVIDGFPAVPIVAQRLTNSCAVFPLSTVPWRECIQLGGKIHLGSKHTTLTGFSDHICLASQLIRFIGKH